MMIRSLCNVSEVLLDVHWIEFSAEKNELTDANQMPDLKPLDKVVSTSGCISTMQIILEVCEQGKV